MALCLGLLPVTVLAAAPDYQVIYVGGVKISSTGYWTTDSDGNVTAYTSGDTPTDNYIHYDVANNTLTLHNATIKEEVPYNTSTYVAGAAIGVHNQNGAAELTITLEGTNTIAEVGKGIYVLANSTGGATLTITGDGSLDASASQTGIWVQSNNGNGALFIQNAKVEATGTNTAGYGVNVQSSNSSTAALTVDGGSLTASGSPGILYDSIGSGTVPKTTALTISNSAIVDARNGEIGAGSTTNLQPVPPSGNGIVFNGDDGTVYGVVTLKEDLTIGEGESLTIGDGASLDTNGKTITVESGGKLEGEPTGSGTVKIAPTITTENLTNGEVGTLYTAQLEADGDTPITWDLASDSFLPAGLSLSADGTISGKPTTANTYTFTVTATNASGSDSKEYTIQIAEKSDTTPPTLTAGTVSRTSDKDATVTFTSDEAGTYFYKVVDSGASKPTDITSGTSYSLTSDTNTITLADLTAGAKDIYIVAKDNANNESTALTMGIPAYVEPVYSISADTTPLDFGSVYIGYTQPAAQTVTITNNGNQPLILNQPASTSSFEVGTLSTTELAAGEKATFTVQPKAGLAVGTYSENITVSGSEGATVTIPASFTVEQRDNTPYYGITVNDLANGTVTCYAKSAAKGAEVTLTVKPDVGYALDKLTVTDASGKAVDVTKVDEKTYTFVMPGSKVTVEAVFAPSTSGLPFTDVSAGDWFYGAVKFVYENGLMDGVGNNLFAPNATLNRAMAVTILYRLEGSPDLDGENLGYPFADVDGNAWYGDAVYWARCNGIVDGVENNHFDPTGSLTREQMATVLYRYAQYKGADVSASGDISGFVDSANVSDWAVDAVKWAVGTGLVNGVEGNALAPQGTSPRAQAAAVLMRLSQAMGG